MTENLQENFITPQLSTALRNLAAALENLEQEPESADLLDRLVLNIDEIIPLLNFNLPDITELDSKSVLNFNTEDPESILILRDVDAKKVWNLILKYQLLELKSKFLARYQEEVKKRGTGMNRILFEAVDAANSSSDQQAKVVITVRAALYGVSFSELVLYDQIARTNGRTERGTIMGAEGLVLRPDVETEELEPSTTPTSGLPTLLAGPDAPKAPIPLGRFAARSEAPHHTTMYGLPAVPEEITEESPTSGKPITTSGDFTFSALPALPEAESDRPKPTFWQNLKSWFKK